MHGLRWMEVQMKKASPKMRLLPAIAISSCAISALVLANIGAAAGAATVFSPDKGKLLIQLNGETIGSEQFELTQTGNNWLAKGTTELKVPGTTAATSVSGTLMLQPDGAPISYDWTSHADKTNGAHVVFSNGTAKITLQMQGARPFEQDLSFNAPVIAVLDNNLYDQYALLAKLYDWSKRGTQAFPVLIPQDLTPGTISVEASGSTTLDGKSYEGLRVTTADLEVLLLLDSSHRLMRLEVPSAKVSVVRQ
jgi:phage baseplate assembly protein gpV